MADARDKGRCPTCREPSSRAAAGKLFPFCSQRCWALDLGKWLAEEYRVPESDQQQPASSSSGSSGDDPEA